MKGEEEVMEENQERKGIKKRGRDSEKRERMGVAAGLKGFLVLLLPSYCFHKLYLPN